MNLSKVGRHLWLAATANQLQVSLYVDKIRTLQVILATIQTINITQYTHSSVLYTCLISLPFLFAIKEIVFIIFVK